VAASEGKQRESVRRKGGGGDGELREGRNCLIGEPRDRAEQRGKGIGGGRNRDVKLKNMMLKKKGVVA